MTTYILTMTAHIDANSESAARQAFIDGDWGDISLTAVEPVHTEECDLDEDCSCGANDA